MFSEKKEWIVAGLMSGTSLDGLDIAFCRFKRKKQQWEYEVLAADTIEYTTSVKKKLSGLIKSTALDLVTMDSFFGKFSGEEVKKMMKAKKITPDLVASHGHTIFHQPAKGFTTQIGSGAYITAACGIPVVSDFRTIDVALGGQGAPLVPVGDSLLFGEYDYCLNLGGIANISYSSEGKRIAGDICPANIPLNELAGLRGKRFDKNGNLASKGKVNKTLFDKLNQLSYYKQKFPKSIGREWIDKEFLPLIEKSAVSVEDKLATVCEHIAFQLSRVLIKKSGKTKLLVTGGGALNQYLISRLQEHCGKKVKVIVPETNVVLFKEAIIFAFLGLKKAIGETNVLRSVTGARQDSIGGALYGTLG